jgi:putative N6-adenine-specific DNA methylase
MLAKSNLWLRSASRVLKVVSQSRVKSFPALIHLAEQFPWHHYLPSRQAVQIQVSCSKSRLYHSDAIAQRIKAVLGERDADSAAQGIWVRLDHDELTLSIDSSGELLHRRGYRQSITRAPLRENVAAALLLACKWDRDSPLIDPMCGSGTLAIEAAWLAQGRAPGLDRRFAFERWPSTMGRILRALKETAEKNQVAALPTIIGCDVDPQALEAADQNAQRAGVEIQWAQFDARDLLRPEGPAGLLIANPPYGKRLQGARAAELFSALHERFADWRVAYLHAGRGAHGKGFQPLLSLKNGGINVSLVASRAADRP